MMANSFSIVSASGFQNLTGHRRVPRDFGRAPAFWTAPTKRSDDGALERFATGAMLNSFAPRPQNPKRRGAPLSAALHNAGVFANARLATTISRKQAKLWTAP